MTRSQPGKPPHSKKYFSSFVGFTNPVTGTVTCRGHCTWWPRVGKRCAMPRSRKARAAIDRILLAALDINCGENGLQIVVEAELENICCHDHKSMKVVDEVCFLIEEYRTRVLDWLAEENKMSVLMAGKDVADGEEDPLLEELMIEAELVAEVQMMLIIEGMGWLSGGPDEHITSSGPNYASSNFHISNDSKPHLTTPVDLDGV